MHTKTRLSFAFVPVILALAFFGYACATNTRADTDKATPESQAAKTQPATTQPAKTAKTATAKPEGEPTKSKPLPTTAQVKKELKAIAKSRAAAQAKKPVEKTSEQRVERYDVAETLNVRAKPEQTASVVGKLARGSMMPVEIDGAWAKLGENQFVMTKYLSATRPTTRRFASSK